MNKIILCEGETDAILLSYYLDKVAGWKFCKKGPADGEFQGFISIDGEAVCSALRFLKNDIDFLKVEKYNHGYRREVSHLWRRWEDQNWMIRESIR